MALPLPSLRGGLGTVINPAALAQRALTAGNLRAQGRPLLVLMVALGLPLFWYRGFDMYYRNDPSKYSPNLSLPR